MAGWSARASAASGAGAGLLARGGSPRPPGPRSRGEWDDVIYREGLRRLAAEHPDRLRVVHTLTREVDPERHGPDVRRGRITSDLLRELIPDPKAALVYACGPANGPLERAAAKEKGEPLEPRFLETAVAALDEIGVPKDRVKRESYG